MLFLLNNVDSFLAILITCFTSLIPDVVAESCTKRVLGSLLVLAAMILANVVCNNKIEKQLSVKNYTVNYFILKIREASHYRKMLQSLHNL